MAFPPDNTTNWAEIMRHLAPHLNKDEIQRNIALAQAMKDKSAALAARQRANEVNEQMKDMRDTLYDYSRMPMPGAPKAPMARFSMELPLRSPGLWLVCRVEQGPDMANMMLRIEGAQLTLMLLEGASYRMRLEETKAGALDGVREIVKVAGAHITEG